MNDLTRLISKAMDVFVLVLAGLLLIGIPVLIHIKILGWGSYIFEPLMLWVFLGAGSNYRGDKK